MKKNAKTLIILAAVLVVCIGAYIGVAVHKANVSKKESAETAAAQIYPSDWGTPVKIAYTADGSSLSFTFEDTSWYYDGDRDLPLKQSSLTGLVSVLDALSAVRTFDAAADLSQYGLDAPAYTVTSTDGNGNALTLLVGGKSGDNYYAMKNGGGEIYTIAGDLVGKLERTFSRLSYLKRSRP
jgi:hypothetical protein